MGNSVCYELRKIWYYKNSVHTLAESIDVVVLTAIASHQWGPGSIPRLGVTCGFSLLILYSTML